MDGSVFETPFGYSHTVYYLTSYLTPLDPLFLLLIEANAMYLTRLLCKVF